MNIRSLGHFVHTQIRNHQFLASEFVRLLTGFAANRALTGRELGPATA